MTEAEQRMFGWGVYVEMVDATPQAHVTPNNDLQEHVHTPECWCQPDWHEDGEVWVHNSKDRREEFEQGRRPS